MTDLTWVGGKDMIHASAPDPTLSQAQFAHSTLSPLSPSLVMLPLGPHPSPPHYYPAWRLLAPGCIEASTGVNRMAHALLLAPHLFSSMLYGTFAIACLQPLAQDENRLLPLILVMLVLYLLELC